MKRIIIAMFFGLLLLTMPSARADQYPNRPVRLIVPYGAGGAIDVLARLLAQALGNKYGQTFYVVDVPGAGGVIGAMEAANATPDGYTLFFSSEAPLVINPLLYKDLKYDPIKDFAPITQLVRTAFYIVMCPKLPVKTVSELAEYGRNHKLSYASAGFGTTMHLAGEMLKTQLKFNMTHVPYRLVPTAMSDIIACHVDIGFGAFNSAYPLIKDGKLKALAVSTTKRRPETPDVPTLREIGLQNLEQIESSFSLLAPAKTPQPIITLLHDEFVKIITNPAIEKDVDSRGMTVMTSTPDQFSAWIKEGIERYKKIIQEGNIAIK
jgi:tripartite-type tricarboxylate transporter receptor subunit TctC